MSFSERLKEERKRLKLAQVQLAEIVSTTKNSQLSYEKGKITPSATYLEAVGNIGLDVQYLLIGVRSETALSMEERTLLQFYKDAAPAIRKAALAVLVSGGAEGTGQGVTVNGNVTGSVVAHTIKRGGE